MTPESESIPEQPAPRLPLFRSWPRVYSAVLLLLLVWILLLAVFTRAYAPAS